MVWNWDNAFEGFPSGSDYGSVSGLALRKTKEAFLELLEAEHTVDLGVDATVSHTLGQASVLGPATYSEITMESGCLVLDGGALYSYDGADTLGFGDHTLLENVSASDHPQYLAKSGTEIKGPIACTKVSGLTEVLQEYTDTHFLLSNAGHPEDSTPSHGTVPAADLDLGTSSLDLATSSDGLVFDLRSTPGTGVYDIGGSIPFPGIHVALPTTGSYLLGASLLSVEVHAVDGTQGIAYSLGAPLGTGGASYQTNLVVIGVAFDEDKYETFNVSTVGVN